MLNLTNRIPRNVTGKRLVLLVAIFGIYVLTTLLGTSLYQTLHMAPALIWPAASVALVGFILVGYGVWPVIALGTVAVALYNGNHNPVSILAWVFANILQGIAGLYILRLRQFSFGRTAHRLKDVLSILLVGVVTTMIAPTIGLGAQWLVHSLPATEFWIRWYTLWLGGMMGMLILVPFFLSWLKGPWVRAPWGVSVSGITAVLMFTGVCYAIFWRGIGSWHAIPLIYVMLVPLFWIALRDGMRLMSLALTVMTLLALSGPILGVVRVDSSLLGERLLAIELFVIVIAVIFLILAGNAQERNAVAKLLQGHVDQLEKVIGEVKSLNRSKNEFIGILAHELRNPLAAIVSHVELMKKDAPINPEAAEYLGVIDESALAMSRILEDLLDVARISQHKFKIVKEVVMLQNIINLSAKAATVKTQGSQRTISVKIPEEPIYVEADPVRLQQILVNLINNAIKHTEVDGYIRISASQESEGDSIRISVKDDGAGIPSDAHSRIFEPFVQARPYEQSTQPAVEDGRDRRGSGSLGVGLFLSKKFVELHGGTIEVISEGVGLGSEFVIYWPAVSDGQLETAKLPQDTQISEPALKPVPKAVKGTRKAHRVLVVDDNEAAARAIGRLLGYEGYSVRIAFDGPAALDAMKDFNPNVVLLDIGLPGMDGYEVAQAIRSTNPTVILIALTGFGQSDDVARAHEAGFNHHMTKPVSVRDIQEVISNS